MTYFEITLPSAAENVALDEAFVTAAEDGSGGEVLRVWELDHRAVVLGASGRMADEVDLDACLADQIPIVRRSSGGGTVLIGPGALNFTVVLPVEAHADLKAVDTTQSYVLERTAEAMRVLGPDVRVLGSGDLTIDGRKFSGSAQRRLKRWVMVHATVLYGLDLAMMGRYLRPPKRQPSYREGRAHDDFLTLLPLPRAAIVGALRSAWPGGPAEWAPPLELAGRMVVEKYGRTDWTERL